MGIRDIEFNSYETEGNILRAIKELTELKISNYDNPSDYISLNKYSLKSCHLNVKDGIYVFSGDINDTNMEETKKLAKLSSENRMYNQFFKRITIKLGALDNNKTIIPREFQFIGYIANYYEFFDDKGNAKFEIAIAHRQVHSNTDLFLKRSGDFLIIYKVQEKGKVIIPIDRNDKEGLQLGNTILSSIGIFFSVVGVVGAITAGAAPAVIGITVLFAANTVFSCVQSLRLDYIGKDDEIGEDTFLNNPLKFQMGEISVKIFGEDKRHRGHFAYNASEIVMGLIGIKGSVTGFTSKTYLKTVKVSSSHPVLGKMSGAVQKINKGRAAYGVTELSIGIKGLYDNTQDAKEDIKQEIQIIH